MSQVETAVSKFDSAWRSGQLPKISDYRTAGENPRESLLELVVVDLEFRWRQSGKASGNWTHEKTLEPGSSVAEQLPALPRLDDYRLCFPDLGPIDELPVDVIAHEYYVRNKYGDRPAMESYQQRFPQQYPAFCKATESFRDELTAIQREQAESDTISNATAQGVGDATLPPSNLKASEAEPIALVQTASRVGHLPETFGRYKILNVLGQGGMGAVYLAEDPDLERKVAIKVPFFEQGDSKAVLDRFRREAKSIAALHHPNICPIHEVSEIDGTHYMAMAFIEGKPLSSYVRPGKGQDIRAAVKMVRKIAVALHDAHQHGVIHRDLKPDNIMIDCRKEPIIMDFGLARREGKADTQLTTDGQMMGTPNYMPPEQVAGRVKEMGPACDIYSLGVILYELLTGRLPFTGDMFAVLSQVALKRPQPPSAHRAEIDAELDAICQKAMEKKGADRYASMAEFAKALIDHAKGTTGQTEKLETVQPAAVDREPLVTMENASQSTGLKLATEKPFPHIVPLAPKTAQDGNKRKVPWIVAIAGGGAALLLLLAGTIFFLRTDDGTIRVEINDPAIEVTIKGTDIILKKADEGKDVKLSPGEKTLVVEREDFKFETDKLILKRGEKITVQVELISGEVLVRQGEKVIGRQRLPRLGPSGGNQNSGRNVDLKSAIVGGYQPESPTNDWNYVDIQMDGEGNLIWKNAAGKSWSIVLKGDELWTGPDCDYGEKKLAIELNDAGMVSSLAFPGGEHDPFLRNQGASAVVRERTSSPSEQQSLTASKFSGKKAGEARVFGGDLAINFRWCPPGQFTMGSPESEEGRAANENQVPVTLSQGFWMGRTEVTQGLYESVTGATPWKGEDRVKEGTNYPAVYVHWDDATEFCRRLTERERRAGRLPPDWTYRLPTAAEWEYTCRAGTSTVYSCGNDDSKLLEYAWFGENTLRTDEKYAHEVGLKKPNPWGLCDMHGNMWEYCSDLYGNDLAGGRDPQGALAGGKRVYLGGAWNGLARHCRSASRGGAVPTDRGDSLGFRVTLSSVAESLRVIRPSRSPQ